MQCLVQRRGVGSFRKGSNVLPVKSEQDAGSIPAAFHFATVCQVATFNAKPPVTAGVFAFLGIAGFATG